MAKSGSAGMGTGMEGKEGLLLSEVTARAARRGRLTASATGKLCGAALGCSTKTAPRLRLCPHGSIPTAPFRLHSLVLGDLPLLL